jgi:hypothetical protein
MNCRQLLQRGFVGCCLMAAGTGLAVGISCELRRPPDCREQWDQGGKVALAAAGALSTALASFGGPGAE